jgi:hypothetical protein
VDLLPFHEARREGRTFNLFTNRAGDYGGMDSFADGGLRIASRIGYQYKFYPSPLSNEHRAEIKAAIAKAQQAQQGRKQRRRLSKLVSVTPDDLTVTRSQVPGRTTATASRLDVGVVVDDLPGPNIWEQETNGHRVTIRAGFGTVRLTAFSGRARRRAEASRSHPLVRAGPVVTGARCGAGGNEPP